MKILMFRFLPRVNLELDALPSLLSSSASEFVGFLPYCMDWLVFYNSIGRLGGKRVRDSLLATRHVSVFLRPDWCIVSTVL